MRADRLRLYLIAVLVLAAVLNVVGSKANLRFVSWLSLAVFFGALALLRHLAAHGSPGAPW